MSALKLYFKSCYWKGVRVLPSSCCLAGCKRYYCKNPDPRDTPTESPLKQLLDDAATYEDTDPKNPDDVWATQPYPTTSAPPLGKNFMVNPKDMSVILFPGQGTQYIGMGKSLLKFPRAKTIYETANEVLGIDLLKLDTEEKINKHCQVAIVTASLAAVERLREERPSAIENCVATAGFSLGEITALIFGGAIDFEQGLRLVSVRAAAMEAASKERPGRMITVIYGADTNIRDVIRQAVEHCELNGVKNPYCSIANYLYPHCKVVAGCHEAIKFLEENSKNLGLRRTKRVNVSGAFHSEGVRSAVEPMSAAIKLCHIKSPIIRVMSAVNSKTYATPRQIVSLVPKQIVSPVKWQQLLQDIYIRKEGVAFPRTFEVGPGNSLRSILKQVNAKAWDNSFTISS